MFRLLLICCSSLIWTLNGSCTARVGLNAAKCDLLTYAVRSGADQCSAPSGDEECYSRYECLSNNRVKLEIWTEGDVDCEGSAKMGGTLTAGGECAGLTTCRGDFYASITLDEYEKCCNAEMTAHGNSTRHVLPALVEKAKNLFHHSGKQHGHGLGRGQ